MKRFEPTEMFGHFYNAAMRGRFYVYVLRRPDGQPFYVGKGCGYRVGDHEAEARRKCQCHKCAVIRKIWRDGGEIQRDIVFSTEDERTAYWFEALLIRQWRSRLTNVLDCDVSVHNLLPPKPKRISKEEQRHRRMQRATEQIGRLDHRIGLAIRYKREHQIDRLEAEIEAYELWIHPPIQLRLEGF
jgi:hypothetical protein